MKITDDVQFYRNLFDSLKDPFVYTDMKHIIRYLNKAAIEIYDGGNTLIGKSIFDCHNENSGRLILEIVEEMKNGLDERLITDNSEHRIFMRAVRDENGELIGYYERYEPPQQ